MREVGNYSEKKNQRSCFMPKTLGQKAQNSYKSIRLINLQDPYEKIAVKNGESFGGPNFVVEPITESQVLTND